MQNKDYEQNLAKQNFAASSNSIDTDRISAIAHRATAAMKLASAILHALVLWAAAVVGTASAGLPLASTGDNAACAKLIACGSDGGSPHNPPNASSDGAVAIGQQTMATGANALATGWGTTASGKLASAMGFNTKASGNSAIESDRSVFGRLWIQYRSQLRRHRFGGVRGDGLRHQQHRGAIARRERQRARS